jgi:ferrous iron transport protein A
MSLSTLTPSTFPGPHAMNEMIPLELLPAGHSAAVGQLVGGQNDIHRLEELGIRGGTQIEMVQPGSPCIVRLAGQKLCFRADDLLRIWVRPAVQA